MTIAKMWLAWKKAAVPPDAGQDQIVATQLTFYAGAHGLIEALARTDDTVAFLRAIDKELAEFHTDVKRAVAEAKRSAH